MLPEHELSKDAVVIYTAVRIVAAQTLKVSPLYIPAKTHPLLFTPLRSI